MDPVSTICRKLLNLFVILKFYQLVFFFLIQFYSSLSVRDLLLLNQLFLHVENKIFSSQVKEAMQRIHDRGNIGKLILDVEKSPTPLVRKAFIAI